MKIQIFVCGEGLGHTSRSIAVGRELIDGGHEVIFSAYGYSKEHIEKSGFDTIEVPSELKLVGESGSLSIKDSVAETFRRSKLKGYSEVFDLVKSEEPDLIFSDSYFTAAAASKINGIPLVMILNQMNLNGFFDNRGIKMEIAGRFVKWLADTVFKSSNKIIIPDFPPPYTVCEKSIFLLPETVEKVEYVGPLVQKKYGDVEEMDLDHPHVFSLIGGFGYRKQLLLNVISTARTREDLNFTLVTGPNVDPDTLKDKPDNVNVEEYIDDVFPYIKASDLVIAPGGHSTMMECLSFGKPLLSFPDMLHTEQQNNAERIEELKLGMKMSYFTPPFMISDCIDQAIELRGNCEKLRDFAGKLDGRKRVLQVVDEVVK
ncbi:MAG: glycosyltransferase family protein [Halobacteriota archaeon]|nr:glycosyltransferase family protein [Halobacteriota archaeon]